MKITDSKSFGKILRNRRKELKLTQKYISEFTGLSTSFISELENGKPSAELEKSLLLMNFLAINLYAEPRS